MKKKAIANRNDLIILDPSLDEGARNQIQGLERHFCINPFDPGGLRLQSNEKDVYAGFLASAFTSMLKDSAHLSLQMEALLVPCISVLLGRPGSSFFDLQRFMFDH